MDLAKKIEEKEGPGTVQVCGCVGYKGLYQCIVHSEMPDYLQLK